MESFECKVSKMDEKKYNNFIITKDQFIVERNDKKITQNFEAIFSQL